MMSFPLYHPKMSSATKPTLRSKLALWCALCWLGSSAARAAVPRSFTLSLSSSAHAEVWMAASVPTSGPDVEFPPNSVVYEREKYSLPPKSFFSRNWYVGILIIVLVVLAAYTLLAVWVCYRLEYAEQRKAKKVVEQAYATNGFFDLDRYIGRGATGIPAEQCNRSSNSSGTALRSTQLSRLLDEQEETYGSYSSSDSSPWSESDEDAVVHVNPLQPQAEVLR
ncbi:hypothetical protein LPMP_080600 [Leishmania panamensis]|uniref:Transmembrane protein n=1 Tax=Leishmania panamensis TaxID=5679 RepID=A0A088RL07_LEIPA|nr:hypothetical protein LPMP_080600 [Leishmania panamensis]AIN95869.1 hypothetical protein LPMP_080600 [Leishmania panamensis]